MFVTLLASAMAGGRAAGRARAVAGGGGGGGGRRPSARSIFFPPPPRHVRSVQRHVKINARLDFVLSVRVRFFGSNRTNK